MKCERCDKDAVTFHGVSTVTHGYCEDHRCCAKCGLPIITSGAKAHTCICKEPTEREDYLEWVRANRQKMTDAIPLTYSVNGNFETVLYEPGSKIYRQVQDALSNPGIFKIRWRKVVRWIHGLSDDERYQYGINAATMSANIRVIGDAY